MRLPWDSKEQLREVVLASGSVMGQVSEHTSSGLTDEELARRFYSGDLSAFERLYERHFDGLMDFLSRLTRNAEEAADVAQDTFMKLLQRPAGATPSSNVRAWLFTVGRNGAIDRMRRNRRQVAMPEVNDLGEDRLFYQVEARHEGGPEQALLDQELVTLVWDAAKGLAPDDYTLLDLSLRQQMSASEVGQVMGVKASMVHTRLSRLKDRLEQAVTALLFIRRGRSQCPDLEHVLTNAVNPVDLNPKMRRAVTRHLASCETCAKNRSRYPTAAAIFGSLAPVVPTLAVKSQILSNLLEASSLAAGASHASAGVASYSWIAKAAIALLAATGALAIGVSLVMSNSFSLPTVSTCSADERFEEGIELRRVAQWQESSVAFTNALRCDTNRIDAWAERGFTYRMLNDPASATRDFETAMSKIVDGSFEERHYAAMSHLNLAEMGHGSTHLPAAISGFDDAINLKLNADSLVLRGIAHRHLSVAPTISTSGASFYEEVIVRGDLELLDPEPRQLQLAISDFNQAIELENDYADAYANRAIAWILAGHHNEALADISQAISLAGGNVSPYWRDLRDITAKMGADS